MNWELFDSYEKSDEPGNPPLYTVVDAYDSSVWLEYWGWDNEEAEEDIERHRRHIGYSAVHYRIRDANGKLLKASPEPEPVKHLPMNWERFDAMPRSPDYHKLGPSRVIIFDPNDDSVWLEYRGWEEEKIDEDVASYRARRAKVFYRVKDSEGKMVNSGHDPLGLL